MVATDDSPDICGAVSSRIPLIKRHLSFQPLFWVCPQLSRAFPPTHSQPAGPISVCCYAPMSPIRKGNEPMQIHQTPSCSLTHHPDAETSVRKRGEGGGRKRWRGTPIRQQRMELNVYYHTHNFFPVMIVVQPFACGAISAVLAVVPFPSSPSYLSPACTIAL